MERVAMGKGGGEDGKGAMGRGERGKRWGGGEGARRRGDGMPEWNEVTKFSD